MLGLPHFEDITPLVLTGLITDNITVPTNTVIGYAGWGVNHSDGSYPSGGNYILNDLLFTYLPGACFMSYESFNGRTFTPTNPDDPEPRWAGNHRRFPVQRRYGRHRQCQRAIYHRRR